MIRKMVVRIDDVGYSDICNIGTFKVFDEGVGTVADVMLDTPGTRDALIRLRNYPQLSIGWHTHFWGSPLLSHSEVRSLVDETRGHFRGDIREAEDIDASELRSEMRAQLEFCRDILGKYPEHSLGMEGQGLFGRIKEEICGEYGIATDFAYKGNADATEWKPPKEKWRDRKIYWLSPAPAYQALDTDSIDAAGEYDPVKYYTEDRGRMSLLPEDAIAGQAWHPGYVDEYVCMDGDRGPRARHFLECRLRDIRALCSDELKKWISDNHIELVNFRDALLL